MTDLAFLTLLAKPSHSLLSKYLSKTKICVHVPFIFLHILALGCLCKEEEEVSGGCAYGADGAGGSDGAGGAGALAGSLDFLFGGF